MNKKGFLLVSFLVYLMIFSVVVCLVSMSVTNMLLPALAHTKKYNALVRLYNATDILVSDLRNNSVHKWKKSSSHEIVWQTDEKDIGWFFDGVHLERREGVYKKKWNKSIKSIIPCTASSVVFIPEYDSSKESRLIGITMQLSSVHLDTPLSCYGALRYKREYAQKNG